MNPQRAGLHKRSATGLRRAARCSRLSGRLISMECLIQTLAVAEHLSFRHAATTLGISQSSVSQRVRRLEREIGITIFERSTRGVRMTQAGRSFVDKVAEGMETISLAVENAGREASGQQGVLRIGIPHLILGGFLDELLERYRHHHPGVAIELSEGSGRAALEDLRAGRLDVAFIGNMPDAPDCHSRPVWTETVWAALPASHPLCAHDGVTWDALAGETFLVREGGTGPQVFDYIASRLGDRQPPPKVEWLGVERSTLLSRIARNHGVTIVGSTALIHPPPGVAFRPVTDEPEPAVFSAIWSPHNHVQSLRNLFALADELNAAQRNTDAT